MLIQIFSKDLTELEIGLKMVYNFFRSDIEFFQYSETDSGEDDYKILPLFSISEVLEEVKNNINWARDNLAIYYNSGQKIYVKVFKNAKFNFKK